jgi:hypothetical protein
MSSQSEFNAPQNQLEERVQNVWCQVFRHIGKQISTNANFFSIGGHSLSFMELYYRYQSLFGFDTHKMSIARFLQQPTIVQHAKLLEKVTVDDVKATQWHTLHINQGKKFNIEFLKSIEMFHY